MPSVPRTLQLQQPPHPPRVGPHRLLVQARHCRGYACPLTAQVQSYFITAGYYSDFTCMLGPYTCDWLHESCTSGSSSVLH